jgi:hypothetical protein
MMQPARIRHSRTLIHRQPANFLFYKVFTQENATSFLRKSSSPFSLQELRPLTPLKATDRFTSLTVIGMTKIMCISRFHCIFTYAPTIESPWAMEPILERPSTTT